MAGESTPKCLPPCGHMDNVCCGEISGYADINQGETNRGRPMEGKKNFGKYLKDKRTSLGLSQRELGVELGVTVSAVSKWERGVSYPDITMIEPICRAIGVSEHELITASDDWRQRQIERDATAHRRGRRAWLLGVAALYAAICVGYLIADIQSGSFPAQTGVAATACLLCLSFTHVPVVAERGRKGMACLAASWAALQLLMLSCCLRDGSDQFPVMLAGTTLAYWAMLAPSCLIWFARRFPDSFPARNRGLAYLAGATVLLFLTVTVCCLHDGTAPDSLALSLTVAATMLLPVWGIFLVLRYLPAPLPYRAAGAFAVFGAWIFAADGLIGFALNGVFRLHGGMDLSNWADVAVRNDNIAWICLIACLAIAGALCIAGTLSRKGSNR